ncbi:hypothetical protein Bbelb_301760 [Branchiostoma belcheri]|nr:hypothetical protein Bbelb_301760 [Branchiostoma belcheri]
MATRGLKRLLLVCCCFLTLTWTVLAASTSRPSPSTARLAPAQSTNYSSTTKTPPVNSSDDIPRSTITSLNMTSPPLPLATNTTVPNTPSVSTFSRSVEPSTTPLNTPQAASKSPTVTKLHLKTVLTTVDGRNFTSTAYPSPPSGLTTTVKIVIAVVILLVVLVTVLVGGWWVYRRNAAINKDSVKPSIELTPQGTYKPSRESLAREVTPNYLHLIHDVHVQSPKSPTEKSLYQNKRRLYLYDDIDISDTRKSVSFKDMVPSSNGDIEVVSS